MKLSIHDLSAPRTIRLAGDEPWLDRLYADFPLAKTTGDGPLPRLSGELTLELEAAGSVRVSGKLAFAPVVPCSRCDLPLTWPLALPVDVRFLPADVNPAPREKNLSSADLDAYFLEDDAVDLEQLVNDTIQTSLPMRILDVVETEGKGQACRVCHADLSGERVYVTKTSDAAAASPFAALKGLKLPN